MQPRARVIIDNDFSGDPDGLVQLAHHVLSPSVEIAAIIGSQLGQSVPFGDWRGGAARAADRIRDVLDALGRAGEVHVIAGSDVGLTDTQTPVDSDGARAIVAEAMRDDTDLPLFIACGGSLTELASAWLLEPRIAERLTLVWIGGQEYPGLAVPPPGYDAVEYNLNIDITAARVVFNDSSIPIWQVPRDAYRQAMLSRLELEERIRPCGAIGALLFDAIDEVETMAAQYGLPAGETYIYGDNPLVLLTALQSSFQADPSSSRYEVRPAPRFGPDGMPDFDGGGRSIRVYTQLDNRLMFEDLFLKLKRAGRE
ncbi:nucleoside hydrolase [Microbacterium sp. STN6]|uniref:nucleoside hydrolase n=1 Tax=Microbacterium sp. STN6 TaxID=2995588 RepID=UPI0022609AB3|nr:nucleoside hydrolase [Microbacterium sp. STN6]MCX7522703.1 nucleoside hydrolase [Microbacterium sp. STN6]